MASEKSWPVPVSAIVCGLPSALSVICTLAARTLPPVGLNVTWIWQVALTASMEPQLLVWVKSLAAVPEIAMEVIVRIASPVLVSVVTCGELFVPINCGVGKLSDEGLLCTVGATICSRNVSSWSEVEPLTKSSLPSPLKSPTVRIPDPPER
jgi:hypothetical protein